MVISSLGREFSSQTLIHFAKAEVEVDLPEGLKVPGLQVEKVSERVVLEALFWWKWNPFFFIKKISGIGMGGVFLGIHHCFFMLFLWACAL